MGIEPWLLFLLCSIITLSVVISLASIIILIKSVRHHYSVLCYRVFVFCLCVFLFVMLYILCIRIAEFIPEEMLNKVILFIFFVVTVSSYIVFVNIGDDEEDGYESWSLTKARLRHLIPSDRVNSYGVDAECGGSTEEGYRLLLDQDAHDNSNSNSSCLSVSEYSKKGEEDDDEDLLSSPPGYDDLDLLPNYDQVNYPQNVNLIESE